MLVKVLNFSDLLLEGSFSIINFITDNEGFIGIHENHETMKFKIKPSKIILRVNKEISSKKIVLYSGFGFASVKNNCVSIVGYPISENREKFELSCNHLNEYGKKCINEFFNLA